MSGPTSLAAPGAGLVSVGLPVLRADGFGARALPVPGSLAGAVESAWLDVLEELLVRGPVTVVCLERDRRETARAVSVARQLLETPGIALVAAAGAPLAAAVVVDAAVRAVAAAALQPADLGRFLKHAPAAVVSCAIVTSVADLDLPGLSLSHHLASYLPGRKTQFLVQLAPEQHVDKLRDDRELVIEGLLPNGGAWAATAMGASGLPPQLVGWLHSRAVAVPPVLPSDSSISSWWRNTDAIELVLHPADPATWAANTLAAGPPAVASCVWCGAPGLEVLGGCAFCGQAAPGLAVR